MLHKNKLRIAVTAAVTLWFMTVAALCMRFSVQSATRETDEKEPEQEKEKDAPEIDKATSMIGKEAAYLKYSNKIDRKIKIVKNTKQNIDLSSASAKMDIMHKDDLKKHINSDLADAASPTTRADSLAHKSSLPEGSPSIPDGSSTVTPASLGDDRKHDSSTHINASTADIMKGTESPSELSHSSADPATTIKTTAATSISDAPVISAAADSSSTSTSAQDNDRSKRLMEILNTI